MRLLYLDECRLHAHPHLVPVWQRRGQPTRVRAAGVDQTFARFGALDYRSGVVTTLQAPTASAIGFEQFLDQLLVRWPDEMLVLVLDNAAYHKTPALRSWFAEHRDRVIPFWLPTYSPHLNLIERVWRFIKQKLACHRFWNNLDGLAAAAQQVCTAIRATFAAPTYPHITLCQDF